MIIEYDGHKPALHDSVYVAEGAKVIGQVTAGAGSGIWFNTVLRGDEGTITIGERCNIQDNCTVHLYEGMPVTLEDEVSVGHNVILHGCTVKKGALVGMGATVLDGAVIGEQAFIAAGTLVPPGKVIPPRVMVMGSPAKVVRELTQKDLDLIQLTIDTYEKKAREFKSGQPDGGRS